MPLLSKISLFALPFPLFPLPLPFPLFPFPLFPCVLGQVRLTVLLANVRVHVCPLIVVVPIPPATAVPLTFYFFSVMVPTAVYTLVLHALPVIDRVRWKSSTAL